MPIKGDAKDLEKESLRTGSKASGSFVKNTAMLASGNIIAQLIIISLIPIVTRLYPPSVYGFYATFVALVGIFSPVSTLRYQVAIQLPVEEHDADAIALLSILTLVALSMFLMFVLAMWGPELSKALKLHGFVWILHLVPVCILLEGLTITLLQWYLRAGRYRRLAASRISGAVTDRIFVIGMGLQGSATPIGLIGGKIAGNFATIGSLAIPQRPRPVWSIISASSIRRVKNVAVRYKEFPKYAWATLIQRLGGQMPIILLSLFFTPAIVGYFALARRVLNEPAMLVGEAVSRSFYQKIAQMHRDSRDITELSMTLLRYMITFTVLPMMLFSLISEELFVVTFGKRWQEAGIYAQVLFPVFISNLCFSPMRVLFDLLEKQKERVILSFVFLSLTAVALTVGAYSGNPFLTMASFSLVGATVNVSGIVWILSKIGIRKEPCIKIIALSVAPAIIFCVPVTILKYFLNMSNEFILVCAAFSFLLFCLWLFLSDESLRREAISLIRR